MIVTRETTDRQRECGARCGHYFGDDYRTPVRLPIDITHSPEPPAPRPPAYWSERFCRICTYRQVEAVGFTPKLRPPDAY